MFVSSRHKVGYLLLILALCLIIWRPSGYRPASAQNTVNPSILTGLRIADSGRMLPPVAPRIISKADTSGGSNNIYEARFYWEASSLSNLHAYQPEGWKDALIVSAIPGTSNSDILTAGQPVYIDLASVNDGRGDIPEGSSFRTAVYLDGALLEYWDYDGGLPSGWYLYLEDYESSLTAGRHYLELKTDAGGSLVETSEADNTTALWIYVDEAASEPEIRVEPTEIYHEMPANMNPQQAEPKTLRRNPGQFQTFDPSQYGLGAEITPPTWFILPEVPLAPTSASSLPMVIDHSRKLPPVGNQGGASSCTAWAVSYYYKSYQEGLDQGWNLTDPAHQFSPNFVWNQIQPSSTCGGTWPGNAFQLLTEKGDVPLSSMPYTEDCHVQPDQAQLDLAANYRAENFGRFFDASNPPGDAVIQDMKAWLASGELIQISVPVYEEFDHPSGPYCIVEGPNTGAMRGGHAITIVGYDDNIGGLGEKGFKFVNSWGTGYGCDGFAYLTYDWVKANAWEAWWMRDIRTGANTFRDFTIYNDGAGSLTISNLSKEGESTWLQLALPKALPMIIEPGEAETIQLAFDPAGLESGNVEETVLVLSDDTDEPQTRVQVTLQVDAPLTAAPPVAANPQPGNQAADLSLGDWNLSWTVTSASSGTLYDVRLDTSNPPATVICNDQSARTCPVQGLRPDTHYYWRVVSQTPMNSTLGPVWEFTTGSSSVVNPEESKLYIPIMFR